MLKQILQFQNEMLRIPNYVNQFLKQNYIHWLSLELDIGKNEWLKKLPMNDENGVHMKHMKIPLKKRPNCML
jgi:hypothetical protein